MCSVEHKNLKMRYFTHSGEYHAVHRGPRAPAAHALRPLPSAPASQTAEGSPVPSLLCSQSLTLSCGIRRGAGAGAAASAGPAERGLAFRGIVMLLAMILPRDTADKNEDREQPDSRDVREEWDRTDVREALRSSDAREPTDEREAVESREARLEAVRGPPRLLNEPHSARPGLRWLGTSGAGAVGGGAPGMGQGWARGRGGEASVARVGDGGA